MQCGYWNHYPINESGQAFRMSPARWVTLLLLLHVAVICSPINPLVGCMTNPLMQFWWWLWCRWFCKWKALEESKRFAPHMSTENTSWLYSRPEPGLVVNYKETLSLLLIIITIYNDNGTFDGTWIMHSDATGCMTTEGNQKQLYIFTLYNCLLYIYT